ncbi:MAG: hypothetical protein D6704_00540 [Nitrospirae bacterium]|nr:MAG: hypothetical protein D6704_00540 [Nitrospirota bacterium]
MLHQWPVWLKSFIRYWLPVVIYGGSIFYLSALPDPLPAFGDALPEFNDKILHGFEYGLFGILWYRGFRYGMGEKGAQYAAILAIVASILYGMSDEYHQWFVPLRTPEFADLLADGVGAAVGVFTWQRVQRVIKNT